MAVRTDDAVRAVMGLARAVARTAIVVRARRAPRPAARWEIVRNARVTVIAVVRAAMTALPGQHREPVSQPLPDVLVTLMPDEKGVDSLARARSR